MKEARSILRSTALIGGSSLTSVAFGIVKTKFLAIILGPTGIGLIAIYNSVLGTATSFFGMGLGNSATRQIAMSSGRGDEQRIANTRKALKVITALLSVAAIAALGILSIPLSKWVMNDVSKKTALASIGIGVAMSVLGISCRAYLTGLRKIADLAKAKVWASALTCICAIVLGIVWGRNGIIGIVLVAPFFGLLVALVIVKRIKVIQLPKPTTEWKRDAQEMLRLGATIMLSGVAATLTGLIARSYIIRSLGMAVQGQYSAASTISITYLGFILAAMSTDYFPKLAQVVNTTEERNRVVNDQAEISLLIAGPIIVAMTVLAPIVISAFYSRSFEGAVPLLKWQMIGNVFKVAAWPTALVVLARGAALQYFLIESSWNLFFLGLLFFPLGHLSLGSIGVAYAVAYGVYFVLISAICKWRHAFVWRRSAIFMIAATLASTSGVLLVGEVSSLAGYVSGCAMAIVIGALSMRRILRLSGVSIGGVSDIIPALKRVMRESDESES